MKSSRVRSVLLGLTLTGSALLAHTPVALAQAGAPLSADSYAACKTVITNFSLYEMMVFGATRAVAEDKDLEAQGPERKARFQSLLNEEFLARRERIIDAVAELNCNGYTDEQVNDLLKLSQSQVVRDFMWYGADPTRPQPQISQMSDEDVALLGRVGDQPWFARFMTEMDMSTAEALLVEAMLAAQGRFEAP